MPPYSCLWGIYYLLTYTASRTVITPTWEEELKVKLCISVALRRGGRRIKDVSVHVPYFSVVANDVAKVPCLEIWWSSWNKAAAPLGTLDTFMLANCNELKGLGLAFSLWVKKNLSPSFNALNWDKSQTCEWKTPNFRYVDLPGVRLCRQMWVQHGPH